MPFSFLYVTVTSICVVFIVMHCNSRRTKQKLPPAVMMICLAVEKSGIFHWLRQTGYVPQNNAGRFTKFSISKYTWTHFGRRIWLHSGFIFIRARTSISPKPWPPDWAFAVKWLFFPGFSAFMPSGFWNFFKDLIPPPLRENSWHQAEPQSGLKASCKKLYVYGSLSNLNKT